MDHKYWPSFFFFPIDWREREKHQLIVCALTGDQAPMLVCRDETLATEPPRQGPKYRLSCSAVRNDEKKEHSWCGGKTHASFSHDHTLRRIFWAILSIISMGKTARSRFPWKR